jgi:hypothetical protein
MAGHAFEIEIKSFGVIVGIVGYDFAFERKLRSGDAPATQGAIVARYRRLG